MMRRLRLAGVTTLGVALTALLAACSSSPSASSGTTSAGASSPRIGGTLNVFAAASLTEAFDSARSKLTTAHPGLSISYSFAGTNTLVAQIEQGAPADVIASADTVNMNKLVAEGLVETPAVFARNKLEIAVAPGNPKHITDLADLARTGVSVVLEAQGVPAGDYTRALLARLHLKVTPRSLETDVKSALAKVASGEADATVVYVTDVRGAGPSVAGIAIPDSDQPSITYPIAVVKASRNQAAAHAFVQSAVSGDVQDALEAAGFLPPG